MNKRLSKLTVLGVLTTGFIYLLNTIVDRKAQRKNLLPAQGRFYTYKNTDIFYSVKGTGTPILLIHDLMPQASGYEWEKVRRKLEKTHKVYVIDLPGCGRSEKPWMTYTAYYFVECIHGFLKEVIKEKTILIASGLSAHLAILTDNMYPDSVEKVILINPEKLSSADQNPDTRGKVIKFLIDLPIFGRFIYNIEMSEENLSHLFYEMYFMKKNRVDGRMIATYYEAAHRGIGDGRHLLASLRGHYLNANVRNACKDLDNLCIITSRERKVGYMIQKEYEKYAKSAETAQVSGSKLLPQLETPDHLADVIKLFL